MKVWWGCKRALIFGFNTQPVGLFVPATMVFFEGIFDATRERMRAREKTNVC
jgi:hypothetical protein